MPYRVVMPRSIPFAESNRVQQAAWKRGYSIRLAGRDPKSPAAVVVEFLKSVDELPAPESVRDFEHALEAALASKSIAAQFGGRGAWLETVRERR